MLWLADNDEKRIARGVAKGDKRAMRALYALVAGSMSSACRRYIPQDDDAQDVVQDAFLSIITHIGDFVYQGKGSPKDKEHIGEVLSSINASQSNYWNKLKR